LTNIINALLTAACVFIIADHVADF